MGKNVGGAGGGGGWGWGWVFEADQGIHMTHNNAIASRHCDTYI